MGAAPPPPPDPLRWREQLAVRLTQGLIAVALLAAGTLWFLVDAPAPRLLLTGLTLAVAITLGVSRGLAPPRAASAKVLVGVLLALVFGGMAYTGVFAGPALAAAVTTIVAGLLFERRGFLFVVALEGAGAILIAWAMTTGRLAPPLASDVSFTSPRVWLRVGLISGLLLTVCVILVRHVVRRLEAALEQARAEVARREVAERERLAAQEVVLQAQKLEAVAQVAAGIAHDFNNLLAVVGSQTEGVLRRLPADSAERRDLEIVSDVVAGGAGLTRQLLLFSRQQVVRTEIIALHDRLRATARLLGTLCGAKIQLAWQLADEPLGVLLDPSQLEQVAMNLVLNARDAMPDGGTITIRTRVERGPRGEGDGAGDDVVVLEMADTGTGMDAATQARAFEPLFTTKAVGLGTGLGLSTVQQIAHQAGGDARLDSSPGRGTRVLVRLPRAPLPVAPLAAATLAAASRAVAGDRTVLLLVDDEPHLRRALAGFLEEAGIDVQVAGDGAAALAHAATLPRLDGVLCDLSMPGINGHELVRRLRAARPGLPAMIMSGYMEPNLELGALGTPPVTLLAKPFGPDKLVAEVQAMVARGSGEPPPS